MTWPAVAGSMPSLGHPPQRVRAPRGLDTVFKNASSFRWSSPRRFFGALNASMIAQASSQYFLKKAQLICCFRPHVTQVGPSVALL